MKFKNFVALCVAATATGVSAEGRVTLQTNRLGKIDISLNDHAPMATKNFYELCKRGYYDKTVFFRLTTEGIYVVQGGDPTGTGTGGESIYGGPGFKDENLEGATYPQGTVAMANKGPDTNGSQFFIIYKDSPLPPKYTPFGKVTIGLGVIEEVAAGGVSDGTDDGKPMIDFVINKCVAA